MAAVDSFLLSPIADVAPVGLASTGDAGLILPWTYARATFTVIPIGLDAVARMPLAVMLAGHSGADRRLPCVIAAIGKVLVERCLRIDDFG